MSKYCPITGGKVVYLVCQECEERVCEGNPTVTILPKKESSTEVVEESGVAIPGASENSTECSKCNSGDYPACETCCHMMSQRQEKLFGKDMMVTSCEVHRNYLIDSAKVAQEGCPYHNRDLSQEKICLNCEHFLGGGDWGLACAAKYHALPSALDQACQQFEHKDSNNEKI